MKKVCIAGISVFVCMVSSWGFLVHRTVNQLAVYELPKELRSFFYSNMEYLVKHSVRPDLRRNEDSTEATKHFIDLEAFGDSAAWKMPMQWNEAVKLYSSDSLIKYGYVPYYIIVMKERLTNAFKTGNKDSILFYAADIAHYIGDANVPLHTTLNYDGQLTNQKGLHSLWESMIPEIELEQYKLSSRHKAKYLSRPEESIWQAIRDAHILLNNVLEQEKQASAGFSDSTKYRVQIRRGREVRSYTSEFAKAYSARLGKTINQQLIRSADLIADFWYTSWVDAGKPDLQTTLTDQQKQNLKAGSKAFKRDQLLEKKLLFARQNANVESNQ